MIAKINKIMVGSGRVGFLGYGVSYVYSVHVHVHVRSSQASGYTTLGICAQQICLAKQNWSLSRFFLFYLLLEIRTKSKNLCFRLGFMAMHMRNIVKTRMGLLSVINHSASFSSPTHIGKFLATNPSVQDFKNPDANNNNKATCRFESTKADSGRLDSQHSSTDSNKVQLGFWQWDFLKKV